MGEDNFYRTCDESDTYELRLREDASAEYIKDVCFSEDDEECGTFTRKGSWTFAGQVITVVSQQLGISVYYYDTDESRETERNESREENWTAMFNVIYEGDDCKLKKSDEAVILTKHTK